jgi:hypothetical protein
MEIAHRGQQRIENIKLLLDGRADFRCLGDPVGDRLGEKGHRRPGNRDERHGENTRRQPGRGPVTRRGLDERRKRGPDHDRRHDRQQNRATHIKANSQQYDENADRRHLSG